MKPALSDPADGKLKIARAAAAALQEIGILLELKGDRYFQARASSLALSIHIEHFSLRAQG